MAARPTWKGQLKISLVSLPIKVFPATESSESLSFNQLHSECQTRVSQKKWCATCAREVPHAEIVKGFEFEPGKYVILLPEELDAVQPPSTREIDLVTFAEASALPWQAIDRAYYLAPDGADGGPAAHGYALLCEAMAGQVGIGKLAIYGREYLVAVSPVRGTLLLYTLHHAAELRPAPYRLVGDVRALQDGAGALKLARQVIAALHGPLDLTDFTDQVQVDLRRLIAAKIAGDEIVVPPVGETPAPVTLVEALMQSLLAVREAKLPKAGPPRGKKKAVAAA